jgi:periplasmic divalent cation tolerance protein
LLAAMLIAWTSVDSASMAESLAGGLIEARLAACVQIDGPIASHFRWEGRPQRAIEYRLTIKFLPERQLELEAWMTGRHPYGTPEWVVVEAEHVAEKYLSWARANSTSVPL